MDEVAPAISVTTTFGWVGAPNLAPAVADGLSCRQTRGQWGLRLPTRRGADTNPSRGRARSSGRGARSTLLLRLCTDPLPVYMSRCSLAHQTPTNRIYCAGLAAVYSALVHYQVSESWPQPVLPYHHYPWSRLCLPLSHSASSSTEATMGPIRSSRCSGSKTCCLRPPVPDGKTASRLKPSVPQQVIPTLCDSPEMLSREHGLRKAHTVVCLFARSEMCRAGSLALEALHFSPADAMPP